MTKKMLIDATHKEETRVSIVLEDNRLDDFDFENTVRKTLKSNIYLVKVTRVEPSLQAAFVDFGGNRHGFLPFPEIHPDYYRIPVADRQALIAEQEAENQAAQEEEEKAEEESQKRVKKSTKTKSKSKAEEETVSEDTADVEYVGGEEDVDERPNFKRTNIKHRYKIQEVIKRNQIMLIQVNKEERGNKGAAVSTYISLPGRYCVLMPNSPRAGGVSRKVSNPKDRQRLKKVLSDLNVPDGMSVIIRTAGTSRTKAEIKRDFEYLIRLWGKIRDLTLQSTAPQLVHEEGDLIMRAIRDLYRRDISEVIVEGEAGHKYAKDFMKTLMPSHAKRVKLYDDKDGVPLFYRYQVEKQIDEIYSVNVHLRSGGYLVINPTEALISVDVNSGKATKGRHIEETALRTNIEAAEEVARQLRLRDLGGLVVIDFIDMEDYKNNRIVERHLKEAMQRDRARIQIGRISAFGLMELSRQRMRPSLVETNFELCDHCHGVGLVRTVETSATLALRAIEEEGLRGRADRICVNLNTAVALYIFNNKREMLNQIEQKYGMYVELHASPDLVKPDYTIDIVIARAEAKPLIDLTGPKFAGPEITIDSQEGESGKGRRRRRRSRGRRGGRNRNRHQAQEGGNVDETSQIQGEAASNIESKSGAEVDQAASPENDKKKNPTKRSGRASKAKAKDKDASHDNVEQSAEVDPSTKQTDDKPKNARSRKPKARAKPGPVSKSDKSPKEGDESSAKEAVKEKKKQPRQKKNKEKSKDAEGGVVHIENHNMAAPASQDSDVSASRKVEKSGDDSASQEKKGGWWNRFKD